MSSNVESKPTKTSTKTSTKQVGNVVKTTTVTTITYQDGRVETQTQESTQTVSGGTGGSKPSIGMSRPSQAQESSAGSQAAPVDIKEFRKQALVAHNLRRKKHQVSELKLSDDLNTYAQKWADHLAKSGSFQHSDCDLNGTRLGENIANKWSSAGADYSGEEVTEQWYSEISKYNYSAGQSPGTGHFSQVVWKGTNELGIGKAKNSDGKVFVVGSYRPAGNMMGDFQNNVFQPK